MGDRKGVDLDGRAGGKKLGGVEGGSTIIRIYYVRKMTIFNKRKKYLFNFILQKVLKIIYGL